MGRTMFLFGVLLLAVLFPCACSGGTSEHGGSPLEACGPPQACGGDLSGTWTVEASCTTPGSVTTASGLPPACLDSYNGYLQTTTTTLQNLRVTFTGSQYSFTGTEVTQGTWTASTECVYGLTGGGSPGDAACGFIGSQLSGGSTVALCTLQSAASCSCDIRSSSTPSSGVYIPSGTRAQWDGSISSYPYCVAGTTATIDKGPTRLKLTR